MINTLLVLRDALDRIDAQEKEIGLLKLGS
jgi:hypothetical protein